jgi:glyoxylase-like metal-dependent hydrolase (beta-lactamase superfamily II)
MRIGAIDIQPLLDGESREPITEVVARADGAGWNCPDHPTDSDGRITMSMGGFLVRSAERTILVDAGLGTIQDERRRGGGLPDNLRAEGVELADVTDVVFTHLHFDHVGWATKKGQVVFPNATYRVHQADWDHFVTSPDAAAGAVRKLGPLESRLETFDAEVELAPGLVARPAPGHTPGSTIYVVADAGERALLLGDVVHAVGELTDPEWHGLYDLDPDAARAMRDRIAEEAAEAADVIAAAHFPGLRFGRLVSAPGGRRTFSYL